jgi:molybdopterin adenylyltransferase
MSATQSKSIRTWIITVSDTRSAGIHEDTVGPMLEKKLIKAGYDVSGIKLVHDDHAKISDILSQLADSKLADLIVTTGGTGLSPKDFTPEATRDVINLEIPGIGECMRAYGASKTPFAWLSRATAGVRGKCMIINLPGSEKGAMESLESVLPILHHAIETAQGITTECGKKIDNGK